MASVYKSISKRNNKRQTLAARNGAEVGNMMEDVTMEEFIDEGDETTSDDDEDNMEDDDEEEEAAEEDDYSDEEEKATNGVPLKKSTPKTNGVARNTIQSSSSEFLPKTRVLMLTSRGVTHRYVLVLCYCCSDVKLVGS